MSIVTATGIVIVIDCAMTGVDLLCGGVTCSCVVVVKKFVKRLDLVISAEIAEKEEQSGDRAEKLIFDQYRDRPFHLLVGQT
jgi:hypothetical protein